MTFILLKWLNILIFTHLKLSWYHDPLVQVAEKTLSTIICKSWCLDTFNLLTGQIKNNNSDDSRDEQDKG